MHARWSAGFAGYHCVSPVINKDGWPDLILSHKWGGSSLFLGKDADLYQAAAKTN